jgi:hypothetical protein
LSPFIKSNHVSIWNWIQHYKPEKISHSKRRIYGFIVDETLIKVGTELLAWVWVWIAIELKDKTILLLSVIDLYDEGKSTLEIAQIAHMSFRDIGFIIDKKEKEQESKE